MSRSILWSLITLIVAQFQTAPTTATQTATLRVTVRELGTSKPIEGVRVRIASTSNENLTDANGVAEFRVPAGGIYTVTVERAQYSGSSRINAPPATSQQIVVVTGGVYETAFSLLPVATIRGQVRDANGKAIPDARVAIGVLEYQNGVPTFFALGGAFTDVDGEYVLTRVAPGEYYLRMEISAYRGAFFPNANDFSTATSLRVRGKEDLLNIDIEMPRRPMFKVSGILDNLPAGATLRYFFLSANGAHPDGYDISEAMNVRPGARNNEFELNIPAGRWLLYASSSSRVQSPVDPASPTTINRAGHVLLNIVDSDFSNVVVHIDDGLTVTGRILLDDMSEETIVRFQNLRLSLTSRESPSPPSSLMFGSGQRANIDLAKFAFPNMTPGKYSVSFGSDVPSDFYVADIRQSQKSVFSDGIINVGADQSNDIEIVLKQGHASVSGSVRNLNAIDGAATVVVLVPAPEFRTNPMLYRTATTANNGGFKIENVVPGTYTLLAWTNMPKGAEQNPEIFAKYERLGKPVTVKENETLNVQLENPIR